MNKIILIGFRCSGKTTIGKKLAEALNWEFLDLDIEIQKKIGKTIKKMVEEFGWQFFRDLEKKEMQSLVNIKNTVVALGGGAVLHEEEMKRLKEKGIIIWLYAPFETILKRIKEDKKTEFQRPALTEKSLEEEIKTILKEREPLYKNFSHIKIDTSKEPAEKIIEKIIKEVSSYEN
ncbi:shikimate kinase AroL [Thermodesulfobacterium hydrogeniphilum]|uniref:shikimate kinase AroL n=1 Tax=Thermodesulfobacterium hydrogeniphilum TaxID=161156 RepID=UPI000571A0EA|nr:shikimate kinase AroL [Thermodesulfobacterium hydrogeniphilum]